MAADKISLQKLCDELESGIKVEEDIKFCKRLGPRSENSRILQIGFKDVQTRSKLLSNSYKLASKGAPWEEISCIADLTLAQRNEGKQLRVDVEKMNDELSEDDAKNWMWKVIAGPSRSPGRRDGRCPGAGAMPGGGVGTGGGERSGGRGESRESQ